MSEEKKYRSSTGVDEFCYGKIDETTNLVATDDEIHRVKWLQNINVEMAQEIVKAPGDNKTAEMAVAGGDVGITSGFHRLPLEDKIRLLGWEEVDGLIGGGSEDHPPYVGVIFTKTFENGDREYVGLPKGIFTRPNIEGQTKEPGSTEFSSEEITAEFMDRKIEGFKKERSFIFAYDEAGETKNRDALYMKIFGKPHPEAGTPSEPEGT